MMLYGGERPPIFVGCGPEVQLAQDGSEQAGIFAMNK